MDLLRYNLHNKLDSDFFLYLTPELTVEHNITTVEKAYEYYLNNVLPYDLSDINTMPQFIPDRNVFLEDFDYRVYSKFYSSNISNDNYITDTVRNTLVDDPERLAIIHYHRVGQGNYYFRNTNIDSNFNSELYKIAHNITTDMTKVEAYYDYLDRKNSGNYPIVIANIDDLTYHISCNLTVSIDNLVVDDTLTVKENMVIHKNAYVQGNMITDSTGLEINGGTIMIDNTFGNTDYMFSQGRLSSNSLEFGNSRIVYSSNEDDEYLQVSGANFKVDSNLFVNSSVMIGDTLVYNPDYSIQTDKKIKVQGNEVLSDARLKTNIDTIDTRDCLDKISKLSVKIFDILALDGISDNKRVAGVLAKETKEVIPHIVSLGEGFVPIINDDTYIALTTNTLMLAHDQTDVDTSVNIEDTYILWNEFTKKGTIPVRATNIRDNKITLDKHALNPSHQYRLVRKMESDVMSVDYTQLFCYLIGAVQELKNRMKY